MHICVFSNRNLEIGMSVSVSVSVLTLYLPCLSPHPTCLWGWGWGCLCVCVCVCVGGVVSVIVKHPALPLCSVDGHSRNPLCYYEFSSLMPTISFDNLDHLANKWKPC